MNVILQPDEKLIKKGKANKTNFINSQGGELILTDKRLLFTGHGKNVGNDAASIPLNDLAGYGKASSFLLYMPIPIPNCIRVTTNSGQSIKFAVNGRKEWLKSLEECISRR